MENNGHDTLDAAFAEDERRWITVEARGRLAVLVLRRMVYAAIPTAPAPTRYAQDRRTDPLWIQSGVMANTVGPA